MLLWDFATTTPAELPHAALNGLPITCLAWSHSFNAVALCSFAHYAPLRVLCFDAARPAVAAGRWAEGASAPLHQTSSTLGVRTQVGWAAVRWGWAGWVDESVGVADQEWQGAGQRAAELS